MWWVDAFERWCAYWAGANVWTRLALRLFHLHASSIDIDGKGLEAPGVRALLIFPNHSNPLRLQRRSSKGCFS